MGPCCHPTRTKLCVCAENADMHLTLGFLGSNTEFASPWLLIFDTKTIKKPLWNRLPRGAILFSIFSDFAAILGANMTPKTSARPPNTPPEATQEPLKSPARPHPEPCKTALNTNPKRPKTPRAPKTFKTTPKSRWGTPSRAPHLEPTWVHFGPATQLICDF